MSKKKTDAENTGKNPIKGWKDRTYVWIYLFALIAGIILVVFHQDSQFFEKLLMIIGILFIVPGVCGIWTVWYRHNKKKSTPAAGYVVFTALATIIFGVLMLCLPAFFVTYLIYTFGILLILCGILQISNVWALLQRIEQRPWYVIVPLLTIGVGIWLLCMGPTVVKTVINLITGIGLIVWSANGLAGYIHRGVKGLETEKEATAEAGSKRDAKQIPADEWLRKDDESEDHSDEEYEEVDSAN